MIFKSAKTKRSKKWRAAVKEVNSIFSSRPPQSNTAAGREKTKQKFQKSIFRDFRPDLLIFSNENSVFITMQLTRSDSK